MAVMIKGYDMPESCDTCPFGDEVTSTSRSVYICCRICYDKFWCLNGHKSLRCPLVEVDDDE